MSPSKGPNASPSKNPASAWFGPQAAGKRKVSRPFFAGQPIEARWTSHRARGRWALNHPGHRKAIRAVVAREAAREKIAVRQLYLGTGELRLSLIAGKPAELARFFRGVGGQIPRVLTGTERGRPLPGTPGNSSSRKFWDGLVSTRKIP